jgi:DNA replication protein DnaC
MMTHETMSRLNEMKLFGMAKGFDEQLGSGTSVALSFEERFGLLVDLEHTYRDNRRLQSLLRKAKLREAACIEDIDYSPERNIERSVVASLALGLWIQNGLNLITTGPTGSGKTWGRVRSVHRRVGMA